MIQKHLNTLVLFIFLIPGWLHAQYGLQTAHIAESPLSIRFQPANIVSMSPVAFSYFASGGIYGGNNAFTLQGLLSNHGYISQEAAQEMVASIGNKFRGNFGIDMDYAIINTKIGNRNWTFGIDQRLSFGGGASSQATIGLALLGNKPYRGQTVGDENVNFHQIMLRSISAGTGFGNGKLRVGFRGKLIQGSRFMLLKSGSYSLFTATDGTLLDIQAEYILEKSRQLSGLGIFDTQGFGLGVDIGMIYEAGDNMLITAAVTNLGFIAWPQTLTYANEVDIQFEGISISSLFADSLEAELQESVDSLMGLLLPDSTVGKNTMSLPFTARAGLRIVLSPHAILSPEIVYCPSPNGANTLLPILNVSYRHVISDALSVGCNLYGGGTDMYGFGLLATAKFPLVKRWAIHLQIASDNLIAIIVPSLGRGFGLFGGVGFSWYETKSQ